MNQPTSREHLSALADGELARDSARFLLSRVAVEGDLPLRWERYHLVRQTLRHEPVFALREGFADAVMVALADGSGASRHGVTHWLRWGAGGAIAASVAVVALMVTRPPDRTDRAQAGNGTAPTAVVARNPMPATVAPATLPASASTIRPPLLVPVETAPAHFDQSQDVLPIAPNSAPYLIRSPATATAPYPIRVAPRSEVEGSPPAH